MRLFVYSSYETTVWQMAGSLAADVQGGQPGQTSGFSGGTPERRPLSEMDENIVGVDVDDDGFVRYKGGAAVRTSEMSTAVPAGLDVFSRYADLVRLSQWECEVCLVEEVAGCQV